ncbi:MAG: PH domain-containing protein [Anaerolineae bacterium]|nr:PH domain-containing protein [Anaerolineae bacterium]MDH7474581.1 PH domain-containing protein [Anaerolineae bacterium]
MEWRPRRLRGFLVGLGIVASIAILDILLAIWITHRPVDLLTFVLGLIVALSLPALGLMAYWLYSLVGMQYTLERNGLIITCGAAKQIIPMDSIQQIVPGAGRALEGRMWGVRWPGCWLGHGHLAGLGLTLFYATAPLDEQLLVITPTLTYAISPNNQEAFIQDFETRRQLGPLKPWSQESQQARFVSWPIWSDRMAHVILGLGLLLNTTLFAYLCWRYPGLPSVVPLHFDASGAVDRSGMRASLFVLPTIGLLAWVGNGTLGLLLRAREQVAAYLLWCGTLLVQVLLIVAMLTLVR